MTGPEHYEEAERLIRVAEGMMRPGTPVADIQLHVEVAQVHATLALAAATVEQSVRGRHRWSQGIR